MANAPTVAAATAAISTSSWAKTNVRSSSGEKSVGGLSRMRLAAVASAPQMIQVAAIATPHSVVPQNFQGPPVRSAAVGSELAMSVTSGSVCQVGSAV